MTPLVEVSLGLRILIPMKPLASAKMRLTPDVDDVTRQAAALLMLDRVVDVSVQVVGGNRCTVIGGDSLVAEVVKSHGAGWREERGEDMNSSVALGLMDEWSAGANGVLVVSADVPMVTPADLVQIVDASESLTRPAGAMAIADGGTNAMLWPADVKFPPAFGQRSFARFQAFTAAAGSPAATVPAQGLAFDLDSPRDLEYAQSSVPGFAAALPEWSHRVRLWITQNPRRPAWADALKDEDA